MVQNPFCGFHMSAAGNKSPSDRLCITSL